MPHQKSVNLSIIILSYNTKDILRECLSSITAAQTARDSWEIVVVDNASSDGSPEMVQKEFPHVVLIQNKKNTGFSAGNNIGIRKSKGTHVLLLNSDTEVGTGAIQETLVYLEHHEDAGAVTCRLVRPDGSMDPACHRGFPTPWAAFTYFIGLERIFPSSPLFGRYHQGFRNMAEPHEIDSPSGAFFMIKKKVIDRVGLLDERFFMYGEDLDWAYRIKQTEWKIIYYPYAEVLHKKWQSGKAHPDETQRRQTQRYFFDAMQVFYNKHYQKKYGWLATILVHVGVKLRSLP